MSAALDAVIAREYRFYLDHPRPFNPATNISYALPTKSIVKLQIFNLLGQRVTELVNTEQEAGYHRVEWLPTGFATGVYFYRLEAAALDNSGRHPSAGSGQRFVETRKLLFLK